MSKRVLVAMSGGVDSSVAAILLKEQGYQLIGATMQVWPSQPDRIGGCCSLEAVSDAQKVAANLGIPHYTLNYRDYFQQMVIDDFIREYQAGRTPNPCIRCNQFLKFDALLKKAEELKCDFIATGHYARIAEAGGVNRLLKAADERKDQSYVLYVMNQAALSRTLFPLGDLTKQKVRQLAKEYKLPVAEKPESQEICFIEDDNYVRFLKEKLPEVVQPGEIINQQGKVVGKHEGIAFYTIGQRKGIGFFGQPMYVTALNPAKNQVVIGNRSEAAGTEMVVGKLNFPAGNPFGADDSEIKVEIKIRSTTPEAEALVSPLETEYDSGLPTKIKAVFTSPQFAITPGQSAVFYRGDEVVGGGVIEV